MEANNCPLIDRVPPEIRLRIFKYALYHDAPLVPVLDPYFAAEARARMPKDLPISLFFVNKLISSEALDAFYEVNVVRLAYPNQQSVRTCGGDTLMKLVRNLVIMSPGNLYPDFSHDFPRRPSWVSQLPKIKTLTLRWKSSYNLRKSSSTKVGLRGYVEDMFPSASMKCIDIGHFQLEDKWSHIHIKHFGLIKEWERAKNIPAGVNVYKTLQAAADRRDTLPSLEVWNEEDDLRTWLMLHHETELLANNLPTDPSSSDFMGDAESLACLRSFGLILRNDQRTVNKFRIFKDGEQETPIKDLRAGSDSKTLEWATELIMLNFSWL